ncbi:unnamed protein product [Calicophoron daubneyi]|uniref:Complex 1 LYR protein domain-containing protein n=1 Tax=Calicophoron daubneyi TaxID=300641 RepID=A0AAV2T7U8_CALDB
MQRVHSKLQLQVIKLYRDLLRAVIPRETEPTAGSARSAERLELRDFIRTEFRREAGKYKKTEVLQIEAALRRGQRRLEDLNSGTVNRISRISLSDRPFGGDKR